MSSLKESLSPSNNSAMNASPEMIILGTPPSSGLSLRVCTLPFNDHHEGYIGHLVMVYQEGYIIHLLTVYH